MSYGFNIIAPNKIDAKVAVEAKFADIVKDQPVHALDLVQVLANANAVIDLLPEDKEGHEVSVTLNGYVSTSGAEVLSAKIEAYASWVLTKA